MTTPTVSMPTVVMPGLSTPGLSTPGLSTPGLSTPGLSTPGLSTPTVVTRTATRDTVPAVVSTAIASLLRSAPREVVVLASFPQAVYLQAGAEVVTLVTTDGIHHPNAIVLNRPSSVRPLAGLSVGRRGVIGDGRLTIGALQVRATRWWDPHPRLRPTVPDVLRAAANTTRQRVLEIAGPTPSWLAEPIAAFAHALAGGHVEAAVAAADRLIGLGPGMTPAGDDALAGLVAGALVLGPSLAVHHPAAAPAAASGAAPPAAGGSLTAPAAVGRSLTAPVAVGRSLTAPVAVGRSLTAPVAVGRDDATGLEPTAVSILAEAVRCVGERVAVAAVGRTTSVSAALLGHAAHGRLAVPAAAMLRAWTSPSAFRVHSHGSEPGNCTRSVAEADVRAIVGATDRLLAVGSTSGRDLALGLLAAADLVTAAHAHTTAAHAHTAAAHAHTAAAHAHTTATHAAAVADSTADRTR